ncbi:hypothetical protein V498_06692, partial [Pseudogymnoascus sp. VKM F-4517 (FW-2822)]
MLKSQLIEQFSYARKSVCVEAGVEAAGRFVLPSAAISLVLTATSSLDNNRLAVASLLLSPSEPSSSGPGMEILIPIIPNGISKGDFISVKDSKYVVTFVYLLCYICSSGSIGGGFDR